MKRMMKKLTANILAFVLLISGCVFEPGAGLVKAEGAEGGELLYVEYRGAHADLQSAAEEALAVTALEDYKGIVVSGEKTPTEEKILTGEDFAYLNTAWKHASVIDLGGISVKDNAMGSDYMYEDEDGNTVEGTEQIIGSLSMMSSSSKAVQVETLILPADLKTLGMGALAALPNLKVVEIPDSVTDIGWAALYDMPALEKVSYHGPGVTSLSGYMFNNTRSAVELDFTNASGLETVNMSGSSAYIKGFDFTGCESLTSVNLSGEIIDFSAGREKEWLDTFEGEVTYNDQKPMLAISADPVDPLELNGEFSGPPALKGLLLNGTDVLAADAVIPDWIDSSYIADFSDPTSVSVKYIDPSGVEEAPLNTSVGGIHTIQWSFKWIHPQLDYTTFELPVEVIIPEDQKMEDVYLQPGATGGNGTEAKPAPTLSMALSYLKRGGTLHLLGDAALPEGILLPENLTIMGTEGVDKPVLTLEGNLSLSSDLTVDGVRLEAAKKLSVYANGHTLTVGKHMSNEPTAEEINIYGGGTSALSGDTHLVLKGGNFANVSGGCYLGGGHYDEVASDGRLSGDTHIEIGGSAVIANVYGGGYLGGAPKLGEAHVDVGDTYIEMSGGTVGVLYGGGYTQTEGSADAGSAHVTVTGGTVHGIYGGGYASAPFVPCTAKTENVEILLSGTAVVNSPENLEAEAVYGGGYAGCNSLARDASDANDVDDCADVTGNVKLTIQDDASTRAVYGGGYVFSDRGSSARVEGNVDISYEGGSATRIYGGGNYSEYDYDGPMDNAGVGGTVNIYAKGGDLTGTALWGKGTDGDPVAEGASIHIQGYGTDIDHPQKVSSLFHFDTLSLDNSHVLFPANLVPNLSCDDGDGRNIVMKNDSSMTFGHSVAEAFAVNDLTTDGNAAITLHLSDRNDDSAIPLTVNGTLTVSQPIALKLVGTGSREPAAGDKVFVTDHAEGNDSLVSDKFSLQNEEFRLIKKEGALQLTPYDSLEKDEQDPPRNLTGIAPSRYGGEDGIIQGMTEGMEYALSPDGPFTPWRNGGAFAAGTYCVRYAPVEDKKLPSEAVEVTVPEGQHIISYHVENGQLGKDAPLKVAHGASFEFQWKAEEGYMLDWSQCSATGGVLSHEGDNFKVENVTEDVTVTIVATEIPGMVKIIKQPHDVTVRAGHTAVFELTAEGEEEIRYQWYADKGHGFSSIAGETGPTLTTGETAESEDGYLYYCEISNVYGSVTSETVTLRVLEAGETVEAEEQDNAILGITAQTEATIGDVLPFTAFGGGMDNTRPAQGDTRFVPLSWSTAMDNGSWTDAPYSAEIRTDRYAQGEQTLTVIFAKQRYNGAEWENLGIEDEKTVTFRLKEKEDSGNEGGGSGDSGNEGGGSGDSGNEGGGSGDSGNEGGGSGNSGNEGGGSGNSGNEGGGSGDSGNEGGGSGDSGNHDPETGHPQTGDTAPVEIYATLAMVAGCSYLGLLFKNRKRGMTEQEKKELTASIIAWARKGGRLRKAAAIALLFIIILYYHSIGKRLSVDWRAAYR